MLPESSIATTLRENCLESRRSQEMGQDNTLHAGTSLFLLRPEMKKNEAPENQNLMKCSKSPVGTLTSPCHYSFVNSEGLQHPPGSEIIDDKEMSDFGSRFLHHCVAPRLSRK